MSKTVYLLSLGLLIVIALLSTLQGTRYILSPVGAFQLATLLNTIMPLILGPLLAVCLAVRFADVWRNRADVAAPMSRPVAKFARTTGLILVWTFYVLLAIAVAFLVIARGQLGGEITFLFGPLLQSLPIGVVLFELGGLLDQATGSND